MKSAIQKALRSVGYEFRRFSSTTERREPNPYRLCVLSLIATKSECDKLRVVQIGANDGRINDPLFEIASSFAHKTRLMLIEPQAKLIPYLKDNYNFHTDVNIENVAIGDGDRLELYGVREDFWEHLDVPYAAAKNWPLYRAPTGIVSGSREHVAGWLRDCLPDPSRIDEAIECFSVPSVSLASLTESWSEDGRIDMLQIDTEGFDDRIIMSCNLDKLQPIMIFFEAVHLTTERKEALKLHLDGHGYAIVHEEADAIALRVGSRVEASASPACRTEADSYHSELR